MLCTLANRLRGWVAQKALHAHTYCGTLMPWGPLEDQKSPQGPPLLPWLLMVSERGKTETNISWVPIFCKAPHKIPHSLRVRHFHPYFRVERNEAEKVQKSCSRPRNWWVTEMWLEPRAAWLFPPQQQQSALSHTSLPFAYAVFPAQNSYFLSTG